MSDHIPPSRTPALDLEAVGVCPDCKAGVDDLDEYVAEVPAGDPGREPLTPVAKGVAYKAVFAAIADGRNRVASLVLRDLTAEQLAELIIISADVRTMAEAAQRHREAEEGIGGK